MGCGSSAAARPGGARAAAPTAHPAHRRRSQGARIPARAHAPAPRPQEHWRARGEWGSVSAGVGWRGGTMWALCSALRPRGGEKTAGARPGSSRPRPRSLPLRRLPPHPRPSRAPCLRSSLFYPHSGHLPSGSAISGALAGAVLPTELRMDYNAALVPGSLRPRPHPKSAAPTRRAPLHTRPVLRA